MACSSTPVCWDDHQHGGPNLWEVDHTSQFPRTRQRALAMDLSGPKPFVELFTTWSNLAITPAVDPPFDVASSAATLSWTLSLG